MNPGRLSLLAFLICVTVTGAAACAALRARPTAAPGAAAASGRVGEFVWQDLMTDDAVKSRAFYEQLFGWTFDETNRLGRPYLIARLGTTPVGGMTQVARQRPDEPVAQWLSYLAVADVDAVAGRVTASGGKLLVSPTNVNTHRAAVAVDPQGAPVGLVKLGPSVIRRREVRRRSSGRSSGETTWRATSKRPARSTAISRGSAPIGRRGPTRCCTTC